MAQPFEVIAHPLTIWLAPVGTAFPDVSEDPDASWTKLGTSGDENYDEEGVTVTHDQTIEMWTPAGSTGARKAFRTEEGLVIEFTLVDISADQYAKVLNDATVTQVAAGAGTAGVDEFGLTQGHTVATYALLARGLSPADDQFASQYQVPRCFQNASPEPQYNKGGEPAGLACEFAALEDLNAAADAERFGKLVIQTAAPS